MSAKKKESGYWSSTTGSQHSTGGTWGVGKKQAKKGGCDMIAAPVAAVVIALFLRSLKVRAKR